MRAIAAWVAARLRRSWAPAHFDTPPRRRLTDAELLELVRRAGRQAPPPLPADLCAWPPPPTQIAGEAPPPRRPGPPALPPPGAAGGPTPHHHGWADIEGRNLTSDQWRHTPTLDRLGPDITRIDLVDRDPRNPRARITARLRRSARR